MVRVNSYKRKPYRLKGKIVRPKRTKVHNRKKRPRGKKTIVDKRPVRLYTRRDEYGRVKGFTRRRPR